MAEPKTREAWIDQNWGANPPFPWTIDREMEMPEALRDFSQIDDDVDPEDDYPELPGRAIGTAIYKRPIAKEGWGSPRFGAHDAFEPAHAPAGSSKGGQFVSKGSSSGGPIRASSAAWTGRVGAPGRRAKVAAAKATRALGSYSKQDYEVIKANLPKAQKSAGAKLAGFARTLPALLKAHGKEELQKAVYAGGALKALASGKRPTAAQFKSLRQFGLSLVISAGMFAATGDPTGTIGHAVTALSQEFVNHAVLEHSVKLGAGAARFAYAAMAGGDAAMGVMSPADMRLLQDFVNTLANTVATHQIPDNRLRELLQQAAA